ncbi:hypothetical protein Tco_0300526 [Tanacetum coccineum]
MVPGILLELLIEHRMLVMLELLPASEQEDDFPLRKIKLDGHYPGHRLEIDVVRGQRTTYETELHEVCQAYLSSEARNRALLARLETIRDSHESYGVAAP